MAVRAFPDTNVLLEFKSIREIQWRKLLGTDDEILIVIAQQVTAELNKHRTGPNARLQKRARRATKELDQYETAGAVLGQQRVSAVFGLRPPSSALFREHDLDPSEGDDRIMALMLQERKSHPNDRFVLVSADVNHRQRAKGFGLDAIGVPEEYALEPEPDPRDETIKAQQQRIRDLEDVLPILDVTFADGSKILQLPRLRFLLPEARAQQYMAEMDTAQRLEAAKYNFNSRWSDQINEYKGGFPAWARQQAEAEALKARTIALSFKVKNKGRGDAYSVVVDLTLPKFERFNGVVEFPPLLPVPRPHANYDPGREYYGSGAVPLLDAADHVGIGPMNGRSNIVPTLNGQVARFDMGNLLVDRDADLGRIVLTFNQSDWPAHAFEIPYRALADKMPPASGTLLVKWDDAA